MSDSSPINRRDFLGNSAAVLAGGVVLPRTALSYENILGANDRISLGHVGIGSRGGDLDLIASKLKTSHHVEMTASCDLWTVNRDKAVATNATYYGRAPRRVQHVEDLLAMKDIDGVMISTPEHSHSPILKMATEAGKDAYVEKPMGNVLAEAKAARDAVLQAKTVVQVGTQHRSEPYQVAAQKVAQSGALGDVSKVEIVWNYHGPRWRGRPEVKQIREQDTDWSKWLLTKPARPFDPQMYFEFRLYKEFSSGIPDQWMSHAIDLVHWFMDDNFPTPPSLTEASSHGMTAAKMPTPFRRCSNIPRDSWSAIRPASATMLPASRVIWERKPRSSTLAAKAARAIKSSRKRARTRTTPTSTRSENQNTYCCRERKGCRPWGSTISVWSTWRTGSSACARGNSRMPRCRRGSRIRLRA